MRTGGQHPDRPFGRLVVLGTLAPLLLGATFSVAELTRGAERIFRGRCVASRCGVPRGGPAGG